MRVGDIKVDRDGRTVHGTVMPYNETALVSDGGKPYQERFSPGAFTRSLEQRGTKVRLYGMHSRASGGFPVGKPKDWDDGSDRLRAAFEVFDTQQGNDALTLADPEVGGFSGFSVGFGVVPGGSDRDGEVVVRNEASLGEVSLVDIPAYAGATIDGIRLALPDLELDDIDAWLPVLPEPLRQLVERARSLDPQDVGLPPEAPPAPRYGTTTRTDVRLRVANF